MTTAQFKMKEKTVDVQMVRFEGEVMEIIIPSLETERLQVGDYISYIHEGKYISTRIIHLMNSYATLFIPAFPEIREFDNYNRNYPRYFLNLSGLLIEGHNIFPVNIIDI